MRKDKMLFNLMLLTLIGIGGLQFFGLSKIINYILGAIAVSFGILGYIIKFRKRVR